MSRFKDSHPVTLLVYFLSVFLVTMFTLNPIMLAIALLGGMAYSTVFQKRREFVKSMAFYGVLFLVIALTNPLFSHNGVTPLFFINGNAVTLEAVLFGVDMAAMLVAVMYWFQCFNNVMTSDKLLFLVGRFSPKISIVMSSALRFIPHFKEQAGRIRQAQRAMGLYSSDSFTDRIRSVCRVFSSLVTWAFENAIDTGASMKARGYGLKGRSCFSRFCFRVSDGVLISLIVAIDVLVIMVMMTGGIDFSFYPELSSFDLDALEIVAYAAWGVLTWIPCILEVKENIQWTYYRSKI